MCFRIITRFLDVFPFIIIFLPSFLTIPSFPPTSFTTYSVLSLALEFVKTVPTGTATPAPNIIISSSDLGNIGTYLLLGLIDSMSLSAKNFCLSASVFMLFFAK